MSKNGDVPCIPIVPPLENASSLEKTLYEVVRAVNAFAGTIEIQRKGAEDIEKIVIRFDRDLRRLIGDQAILEKRMERIEKQISDLQEILRKGH